MKKNRKEINDKFCQQFLTADWDGCAANDFFARKVELNIKDRFKSKPKIDVFEGLLIIETAENSVYAHIAHLAFRKQELVEFLNKVSADNVGVPDDIHDAEKYITSYINTVKRILGNIAKDAYDFQTTNR